MFDNRQAAQAAVDELRGLGLGSDRLGVALREGAPQAFERDAETELVHDTEVGAGVGAVIGFLAGMSIAAIALVPGGVLGLGGILAVGAASGVGGAMLGGYLGDYAAERAFNEREELSAARLEPGEVLVAVCSHGHPATVETIMERHGGQLLLRPRTRSQRETQGHDDEPSGVRAVHLPPSTCVVGRAIHPPPCHDWTCTLCGI